MSHSVDVEIPASSNSAGTEDDSSNDPTFVPARARGGRGRGSGRGTGRCRTSSRLTAKKAESSKAAASSQPAQDNVPPVETTQQASPESSTHTSPVSTTPTTPPSLHQNARWSFLLSKYPLHQDPAAKITPTPVAQVKPTLPTHSTPNPVRRLNQNPGRLFPKPKLKTEGSEDLPMKAAEMYGGFGVKSSNTPSSFPPPAFLNGRSKEFQPITHNQNVLANTAVVSDASLPVPAAKVRFDVTPSKKQSSKVPPGLSATDALRYKLLKKLKSKKKKLTMLNGLLGHEGEAVVQPGSSNTVTSSTYDGSTCDDFLMDLLSPATTASNLSPDSTGFLEMLASGQDGSDRPGRGDGAVGAASQANTCANEPNGENFLEDFLSQAMTQRQTEMETEALSALEYFV